MKKNALLEEAKARYKEASEWWDDNRKAWVDDAKFRRLDQWPDIIKKARSLPGKERPCLVVDKLNQYVKQVVNDGRQNRPAVKVLPVDDVADPEVAEGYQGIIRNICNRSRADEAFDTALDHAVGCGFGFFRVLTDYAHKGTFNQEICIKRVRNPLAVLIDPHFQAADGSDMSYAFVIDEVPKDKFKKLYPQAKHTDWDADGFSEGWAEDKTVKVCEYWYKVDKPAKLHLLADGTTETDENYQAAVSELGPDLVPPIVETRDMPVAQVKWCRMTGAEILEEKEWPGELIPIIPVFGDEMDIEGKVVYSGLIRPAKDAQRLYNFARSAFAERVAMTPKAPFMAAAEQIADFEEWDTANTGNHEVLRYKGRDEYDAPLPPPQRVSPADVPAGFSQDMQIAEHDIQGAIGMYNASLGERSNEKSGKAIMARQREGDTATFHYQDNLNRAVGYLGRVLVELIPKVYDSRRVIRMLGEDGKVSAATIDPEMQQPMEKRGEQVVYNLGIGKYDVTVTAGPSYTTKRQEAAEAMMQLTQAAPEVFKIIGDIAVRNMDWPGADKIADRLEKMLPPQLQENEEEDPAVQAIKAQAQQMLDELSQRLQMAEQAAMEASQERDQLKQDQQLKSREIEIKAYEAETERLQVLTPQVTPDLVQQIVQQTLEAAQSKDVSRPDRPPDDLAGELIMPPQPPNQPPEGGFFTPGG